MRDRDSPAAIGSGTHKYLPQLFAVLLLRVGYFRDRELAQPVRDSRESAQLAQVDMPVLGLLQCLLPEADIPGDFPLPANVFKPRCGVLSHTCHSAREHGSGA